MIRASSLTLISKCAAAQVAPQVRIETDDSAARLGSAVHELLGKIVLDKPWLTNIEQTANDYAVDVEDLRILAFMGMKLWDHISEWFPNPVVEEELADDVFGLVGHPDVIAYDPETRRAAVLDHKSGRLPGDHRAQVIGYAHLVLQRYPQAETVYVAVAMIREQSLDCETLTRAEVAGEMAVLREHLDHPEVFTPGIQCQYCPRSHECPAKAAMLSQAISVLAPWGDGVASLVDPKPMARMMDGIKFVKAAIKNAEIAIKAEVAAAGGVISIPDEGREIALVSGQRNEISYRIGETILKDHVGDKLADCLTVGKTKVEKAVRAKADRGDKKKAVEDFRDELLRAGAIIPKTPTVKLVLRRLDGVIEDQQEDDDGDDA